jgi:hypothetical protein
MNPGVLQIATNAASTREQTSGATPTPVPPGESMSARRARLTLRLIEASRRRAMPVDTRIAALIFIVPFTIAVCIVAVESDISAATFTAFLVLSQNPARPNGPEDPDDC